MSLLQSLFTFKGYGIELESGGRRETHKALIAVACNGTQIGGDTHLPRFRRGRRKNRRDDRGMYGQASDT
ncbi:MAG: hypothetical protein ACLRSW_05650 [Christensenellaceae bacterium]